MMCVAILYTESLLRSWLEASRHGSAILPGRLQDDCLHLILSLHILESSLEFDCLNFAVTGFPFVCFCLSEDD